MHMYTMFVIILILLFPLFTGESCPFWKVMMQFFLESLDKGVLDTMLYDPFMPTIIINNL